MLLTSMNYALSLGFALTFVAGGMVAAGLLATFRNLAGLAASPLGAGEAFAGGDLEFTLSLASGSRQRIGITVVGRQGLPHSVDLPPGATRPVAITIPAPKRGHLGLGRISLSSDFPLGIWRAWAYVHFPLTGTVFPAPEAGAPPLPPGRHGSYVGRSSRLADTELAGLRDYERGDALNRIAWKAVARGAGGSPNSSREPAAAECWSCIGSNCPRASKPKGGCRGSLPGFWRQSARRDPFAAHTRYGIADRSGRGTSARGADRIGAVSVGQAMIGRQASPPLTPVQVAWLGALLVSAQWPLWGHLLIWNAVAGAALVLARIALPPQWRALTWHRRWLLPLLAIAGAVGIRTELGYFVARDPCVQFLYLLVGIKFIESRDTRDGTLLICLALFLSLTQFFYVQTIGAALSSVPVLLALGGTLASPEAEPPWPLPNGESCSDRRRA